VPSLLTEKHRNTNSIQIELIREHAPRILYILSDMFESKCDRFSSNQGETANNNINNACHNSKEISPPHCCPSAMTTSTIGHPAALTLSARVNARPEMNPLDTDP
jgi:hypothetical protein